MSTTDVQVAGRHRGARAAFALTTGTVIVATVAVVAGGTAFAYFTHSGSSSSHATVGGALVVSTDVVMPAGTVLYPGGPKGGFTIKVLSNGHAFRITDIVQDPSRPVVVTAALGCPATVGTGPTLAPVVTLTAQHGLTLDVAASPPAGSVTHTYPAAVSISAIAPNACQGATFAIPVVLTGRSL